MNQYAVIRIQNRPAVVAGWLAHPNGNDGVTDSASPRGGNLIFGNAFLCRPQQCNS